MEPAKCFLFLLFLLFLHLFYLLSSRPYLVGCRDHSLTAHITEVPTAPPAVVVVVDVNPQDGEELPAGAAPLKCIDPALMFCQLCQFFLIGYAASIMVTAAAIFFLENEWLLAKLPRRLRGRPLLVTHKTGPRIPVLDSHSGNGYGEAEQPAAWKHVEPELSEEERRLYHEKLAVRNRMTLV